MKKVLFVLFLATLLIMLIGCDSKEEEPPPPDSSAYDYMCSPQQGFHFQGDEDYRVGHLEYLKIGNTELNSDITVTDPEGGDKSIVGVITRMAWDGNADDSMHSSSRVSRANKDTLSTLQHQVLEDTSVEFGFSIYEYDQEEEKYYKAFYTGGNTLEGDLDTRGGELQLHVELEASRDIEDPSNFDFYVGVAPGGRTQDIHHGVSASDKFTSSWGE